ncbi:hypothetical protein OJ996_22035 [Luteolibacter sp. GHJ8]|uniref:Uncharacterized protein n=1 Tax=Luteolibacter rhizosphaerae TaxID=2989719 RepID=A0ABT3G8X6_9BACT|nr:hypothetical protein [Luteolibacter rhizosphaerae]MCW1916285.1 hypothetical protein [Luteolibacter rhizosphaerae]
MKLIPTLLLTLAALTLHAEEEAPAPVRPEPKPPLMLPDPVPLAPLDPLDELPGQDELDRLIDPKDPHMAALEEIILEKAGMSATWPDVEYAEVRGYLYFPGQGDLLGEGAEDSIIKGLKLHPATTNPEGAKLSAEQATRLLDAIRPAKWPRQGTGCYLPHHGFVFYDQAGKIVAHVSPCLLCKNGRAEPGNKNLSTWDFAALSKLVTELGLPVFKDIDEAEAYYEKEVKVKAKPAGK